MSGERAGNDEQEAAIEGQCRGGRGEKFSPLRRRGIVSTKKKGGGQSLSTSPTLALPLKGGGNRIG